MPSFSPSLSFLTKNHTNPYYITHTELIWFSNPLQRHFCLVTIKTRFYICVYIFPSMLATSKFKFPVALECKISFTIYQHVFSLCYVELNSLSDSHLELPLFSQIWWSQGLFLKLSDHVPVIFSSIPSVSFLSCLQVIPLHRSEGVWNQCNG